MAQLLQFLNAFNSSKDQSNAVICFTSTAAEVPFQLMYQVIKFLGRRGEFEVVRINTSIESDWQFQLAVTFLGVVRLYWFSDFNNQKNNNQIITYLENYQGPHKVVMYLPTQMVEKLTTKNISVIELPHEIDKKLFLSFAALLYGIESSNLLTNEVFKKIDKLTSDQACILLNYISVLGGPAQELLVSDWFEKIIIPDRSLFILSQHFFAKESNHFFNQWKTIKNDYSDLFWVTFWSEQLWRAYYVILFNKKNLTATIKKMSYRLPFSFIQRHWKNYQSDELARAHNYLYSADFNIKNGGATEIIESFYGAFLSDHFKN